MVSRMGFGCLGLTGLYRAVSRAQVLATIQRAITGRRDSVVLATKFGNVVQADGSRVVDGSPRHVPRACEASLRRLGVDHIDLYLQCRRRPAQPGRQRHVIAVLRRAHADRPL
jgi:aryl-alcohol dehydrogenase-like predicted oxidoreductase